MIDDWLNVKRYPSNLIWIEDFFPIVAHKSSSEIDKSCEIVGKQETTGMAW